MRSPETRTTNPDSQQWNLYNANTYADRESQFAPKPDIPALSEDDIRVVQRYQQAYAESQPSDGNEKALLKLVRATLYGLPTPREGIVSIMRTTRHVEGGFMQSLAIIDDPEFARMVESIHRGPEPLSDDAQSQDEIIPEEQKSWWELLIEQDKDPTKPLREKIAALSAAVKDDREYKHKLIVPDIEFLLPRGFNVNKIYRITETTRGDVTHPFTLDKEGQMSMHLLGMLKSYLDTSRHPSYSYRNAILPLISELMSNVGETAERNFDGTSEWYSVDVRAASDTGMIGELERFQERIINAIDYESLS